MHSESVQRHRVCRRTALGRFTLLMATEPLNDLPVASALGATNDQDHMELSAEPKDMGADATGCGRR